MTSGGTAWERIAKLVDLTEKGARSGKSDKTRFREMLLSLKSDEKVHIASTPFQNTGTNYLYRHLALAGSESTSKSHPSLVRILLR